MKQEGVSFKKAGASKHKSGSLLAKWNFSYGGWTFNEELTDPAST